VRGSPQVPHRPLGGAERERRDRRHGQQRAEEVGPGDHVAQRRRGHAPAQGQRGQPDRQVHQEDQAPAAEVDHQPAEHRTERRRERRHAGHHRDHLHAPVGRCAAMTSNWEAGTSIAPPAACSVRAATSRGTDGAVAQSTERS